MGTDSRAGAHTGMRIRFSRPVFRRASGAYVARLKGASAFLFAQKGTKDAPKGNCVAAAACGRKRRGKQAPTRIQRSDSRRKDDVQRSERAFAPLPRSGAEASRYGACEEDPQPRDWRAERMPARESQSRQGGKVPAPSVILSAAKDLTPPPFAKGGWPEGPGGSNQGVSRSGASGIRCAKKATKDAPKGQAAPWRTLP